MTLGWLRVGLGWGLARFELILLRSDTFLTWPWPVLSKCFTSPYLKCVYHNRKDFRPFLPVADEIWSSQLTRIVSPAEGDRIKNYVSRAIFSFPFFCLVKFFFFTFRSCATFGVGRRDAEHNAWRIRRSPFRKPSAEWCCGAAAAESFCESLTHQFSWTKIAWRKTR